MPASQPLLLDHAVIGVHDQLDAAADIYRRLGFSLTPRGYHTLGSANHLAIFRENYLELLGFPADSTRQRADLWSYPAGLNGVAFKATDAQALRDELAASGKPVTPWQDFSRPVEIDGRQEPASFRTFQLGREQISNGRLFFCQHNTPDLVWRPADQNHPNGVEDITDIFVISRNPKAVTDLLDNFPTTETARIDAEGLHIDVGSATIHLLSEKQAANRFSTAIVQAFDGDERKVALGLRTRSLPATAAALSAGGIPHRPFEDGLLVAAEAANGVALWFRT